MWVERTMSEHSTPMESESKPLVCISTSSWRPYASHTMCWVYPGIRIPSLKLKRQVWLGPSSISGLCWATGIPQRLFLYNTTTFCLSIFARDRQKLKMTIKLSFWLLHIAVILLPFSILLALILLLLLLFLILAGQQDRRNDLSHPIHADNCLLDPEANECWKEPPAYTFRDYR